MLYFICIGILSVIGIIIIIAVYIRKFYMIRVTPDVSPIIIFIQRKKVNKSEVYKYLTPETYNDLVAGSLTDRLKESLMIHRVKQGRPYRLSDEIYNISHKKFDSIHKYIESLDDINTIPPEIFSIVEKCEMTQEYV